MAYGVMHVERRRVWECCTPSAPPNTPQYSRIPDSYESLGWHPLCNLGPLISLYQTQTAVLRNCS